MLALASGLWIAGCATTEAGETDEPGIAYAAGAVLGQVVSGFFTGFLLGWAGQPQDQAGGAGHSPGYSTGTYNPSHGHKVHYTPPPTRPPAHHHHHHRHR